MNDDLTKRLNSNIQDMQKNYCINYVGCKDRGLNIFCLNNGIVTALKCTMCHNRKARKENDL